MLSPLLDLCADSRGGEEMKQDGGSMNVHSCLPRLTLSVQTGPRAGGARAGGVHTLPSMRYEVFKVSMRVCLSACFAQKHTHKNEVGLCDARFQ